MAYGVPVYGNWKQFRELVSAWLGDTTKAASQQYAEGTWTPTIAGSATPGTQTYVRQLGRYIRVGNLVTAWFRVELSALDGATAGNVLIGGLPFASTAAANEFFTGSLSAINNLAHVAAGVQQFGVRVPQNQTNAELIEFGQAAGGSAANVTVAGLTATSSLFGALTYQGA